MRARRTAFTWSRALGATAATEPQGLVNPGPGGPGSSVSRPPRRRRRARLWNRLQSLGPKPLLAPSPLPQAWLYELGLRTQIATEKTAREDTGSPASPCPRNAEILSVHWVIVAASQRLAFWVMEFLLLHRPAGGPCLLECLERHLAISRAAENRPPRFSRSRIGFASS